MAIWVDPSSLWQLDPDLQFDAENRSSISGQIYEVILQAAKEFSWVPAAFPL